EWVAGDEQPCSVDLPRCRDRVAEALVRADRAEAQKRAAVVGARRVAREDRMGDDRRVQTEAAEQLASALAVHDDAIEAREQRAPEIDLARRSAREKIVGGEDRRHTRSQQKTVELGRGQ